MKRMSSVGEEDVCPPQAKKCKVELERRGTYMTLMPDYKFVPLFLLTTTSQLFSNSFTIREEGV